MAIKLRKREGDVNCADHISMYQPTSQSTLIRGVGTSVLGPLLFLLYTSELFFILENKSICYADDSTLIAVVPCPGLRVAVAGSLSCDLVKVNEWCALWGMKLNASKTKPALTIGRTVLKESDDLVILGVAFDSKMTFENHLCSVSRAASQRLGILRKSWEVFHDRSLLGRCFRGFVLPVLEYCSVVWCSAVSNQWCQFFNWRCVWVWPCTSLLCGSIMYAVQDQV